MGPGILLSNKLPGRWAAGSWITSGVAGTNTKCPEEIQRTSSVLSQWSSAIVHWNHYSHERKVIVLEQVPGLETAMCTKAYLIHDPTIS